jgi:predicted ester cyclase
MSVIDQLFAGSYISHDPSGANEGALDRFKEYVRSVFSAFPDLKLTIDDAISEGDKIVKRWTARCTHKGEFMGVPATGKKLEVTGTKVGRKA